MWIVCIGLAIVQVVAGLVVEWILPGRQAGAMVAILGIVFLIMPFGVMHAYALLRAEFRPAHRRWNLEAPPRLPVRVVRAVLVPQ